ncbi:transcriptional regulator [Actinomycetospora sp. TBRC 11914]|nr:transcriptional regulator [Actinomycetospora sp. TBRC 11914]
MHAERPATDRDADRRFVVDRYAEGSSLREISARLGRSYGYVRRLCLEGGIAMRPRGGPNRHRRPPDRDTS